MIKFLAAHDGRVLVGLGLTARNFELLKSKKPIALELDHQLGLPYPVDVMIFYGETEHDMMEDLAPMLHADTIIRQDSKPDL